MAAIGVEYFEHFLVRMPGRKIVARFEGQAEQSGGHGERAVTNGGDFEIRTQRLLIQLITSFADLFRVMTPIPAANPVVDTIGIHHLLQGRTFLPGQRNRRFPDPVQKSVNALRRCRHVVAENEVGVACITHQLRALGTQRNHAGKDLLVVGIVVVVATHCITQVDFLAQLAVWRILEKRVDAGSLQSK